MTRLAVGVVGAGAIGCFVGGRLIAADAADVTLVGRPRIQEELATHGLTLDDVDGAPATVPAARCAVATDVAAVAGCDVVLVCVKSAATAGVADALARALRPDAIVVSLQNGLGNPGVLRARLGVRRVVAAVVGFNVVSRGGGRFHRGMSGPLLVEACDLAPARALVAALAAAGLDVAERADLAPDQWTKLLVNLNNAVSALTDAPTRELLASPALRRVVAALVDEALGVLRAAGVRPAPLRGVPVAWMPRVLRRSTPLVRLVTRAQLRVDPEARSSMWEDLTRGRATEVDELNGAIVRLAGRVGVDAPLNRRIVALVHDAERAGAGSPRWTGAELWARLTS